MTTEHEHVLAAIELRLMTDGVPSAEIDAYIADELRVPLDHYVSYLLVWGVLEAYRLTHGHELPVRPNQPRTEASAAVLRRLWEHAGAIHEAAIAGGDTRAVVREQVRNLIADLLLISERLLGVEPTARTQR